MIRTVIAGLGVSLLLTACAGPRTGARYFVFMDDASGLGAAAPVYVSGVRIGTVQTVRLDGKRARVDFDVETTSGVTLREDACASAGWYSGAVSPHLELEMGSDASRPLGSGGEIKCVKGTAMTAQVEKISESVTKLLESVIEGKGTIGRLWKDEQLAQSVSDFFAKGPSAPVDVKPTPPEPTPATKPATPPAPKPTRDPPSDPLNRK